MLMSLPAGLILNGALKLLTLKSGRIASSESSQIGWTVVRLLAPGGAVEPSLGTGVPYIGH